MELAGVMAYILLLILLIGLSAFFSASETAFLLLPRVTLRQMVKDKAPGAHLIRRLKQNTDGLLTTILLGNNLVNNAASAIGASLAISLAGDGGLGAAALVMTVVIILFGEILPKTAASANPAGFARRAAPPLSALMVLASPAVRLFRAYTGLLSRAAGRVLGVKDSPLITEEELKTLIEVGREDGALEKTEKDMLFNIFSFTGLKASQAARHRSLIRAIPASASFGEALDAFIRTGYSRLPVWEGEPDNYVGLLHYKDLLFCRARTQGGFAGNTMRPLRVAPGTMPCEGLLELFKKEKINFALVADEYGAPLGIVTMDDLLNSVMGRLYDEYDLSERSPAERIEIVSEVEFIIPGDIKLAEFNQIFSAALESEFFETLAGWLLEQFDALPAEGDALRRGKFAFKIEDMSRRRILSVRVRTLK
ncbi:MAG: hemolysin family protein [Spirochaetaceae bacterium]|jgi:putative hemolysin|nr:hemolysin family protein [Spirochaetaceae bacterium]